MSPNALSTCPACGLAHRVVPLQPGEKALCVRCDSLLVRGTRAGPDTVLAFALTGLVFAAPAILLPFISAGVSGNERLSLLFTGVDSLWDGGMRTLAALVFLCGGLLPIVMLVALALLHAPARWQGRRAFVPLLQRAAPLIGHWAMPEVQVLAVLVALAKLGGSVKLTIGPGFWCYCAMTLALLLAQHFSDSTAVTPPNAAGGLAAPSSP